MIWIKPLNYSERKQEIAKNNSKTIRIMKPYGVEYRMYTGWPKYVVRYISISMGLYRLWYKKVKIGITNNPERRFCEHQTSGRWERMVVKYETCSIKHANEIEKYFISRNEWLANSWTGWSNSGAGNKFYAYILLGERRRNNRV